MGEKPSMPALACNMSRETQPASAPAPDVAARLVVHNPMICEAWDNEIAAFPHTTVFHTSGWARVLNRTYGFTPKYCSVHQGERLSALLPLMEVNTLLGGRRGVSLPFTDLCPPLGDSARITESLFHLATELAMAGRWKSLELRGCELDFEGARPSLEFYGHRLDLSSGEKALWDKLDGSVRRAIKKSESAGVVVAISHRMEDMRDYYRLHCLTRKRQGVPPQPFAFFAQIHQEIISRRNGMIVTARHNERPVASAVYLHAGTHAVYKFGASDETQQQLRGNNLVMWKAIQWYAANGFRTFHFGRTSKDHDGLRRFKMSWGAEEQTVRYYKYDLRAGRFLEDRDKVSGWYNEVFKRLPISVSRLVGGMLYRQMA